ncbi:CPBP family intramembrane metalloprotease [Clostridium sporogenes]|uniref:CPBP family intramembrane glutamic endopeptidase n=1 Tax=Clostridium sporogenes TaxID=1509 RepID=UPI0013D17C8A|nr:CPBP family intramembrane glutamic endopeptidase [Clostridium sporogenes]EJE7233894.1 CPBP family intramembrane metalloprotease [Clostridium botulinum]NFE81038.1 CPBP family intramembrane metalloprotease [Clostridium sporogenes]NFG69352.1 CPBP family intramembrane metalloprotease [Clostridium sporogenes]
MKEIMMMINPFKKDVGNIPKELYVIKKLVGFIVVFISSKIIAEAIVILGLAAAGYNFLQGEMPSKDSMTLIKYYGFSLHLIITILYCKFIEKRSLESMGIVKKKIAKSYFLGTGIAVILVCIIFVLCVFSGAVVYYGKDNDINIILILAYLGGFIIQGAMEEIMCRGFLMNSLLYKIPTNIAILISSAMFAFPHFFALFQSNTIVVIVGIVNLLLFSTVVSLLMIKYNNIWVSCAVHSIWNFILSIIIGINLSGSNSTSSVFKFSANENMELLSGGKYGIEAGLICTIVLILFVIVLGRKVER